MNPTAEPDGLMMAHPGPEGDSISDGPVADGTGGPGRCRPGPPDRLRAIG